MHAAILPVSSFAAICWLSGLMVPHVNGQESVSPAPADIWQRMITRYSQLSSYQDRGEVVLHSVDQPEHPHHTSFKTSFVRPGRFKLEWIRPHPYWKLANVRSHNVVWSNGGGASSLTQIYGYRSEASLPKALIATGALFPLSRTVAEFLVQDPNDFFSCDRLATLSLLANDTFEDVACYHLSGIHSRGVCFEAWISQQEGLLRKLEITDSDSGKTEEIHRNVRVDEPVPDKVFEIDPSTWKFSL